MTPQDPPRQDGQAMSEVRRLQIAVAVLAVVTFTLLITAIVLRGRADSAVQARDEAVASAEAAELEATTQQRRNEQLLTQLSTSNERLAELTGSLSRAQLAAADRNVEQQVAAQRAAEKAAGRAGAGAPARAASLAAQLRNAQTCAAGSLLALSQIHAGPDLDSGTDEAVSTLEAVLPSCAAGLG